MKKDCNVIETFSGTITYSIAIQTSTRAISVMFRFSKKNLDVFFSSLPLEIETAIK